MFKQYDPRSARATILKRTPPDEFPVSERVMDNIEKLFGERLTAEEAVTRILKDVRMNGDSALQNWTKRLDSIDPSTRSGHAFNLLLFPKLRFSPRLIPLRLPNGTRSKKPPPVSKPFIANNH